MSLIAILLISVSAIAHASWNFLGKRQNSSATYFWLASLAATLLLAPALVYHAAMFPKIPLSVWLYLGLAGLFQTTYYIGLANAYQQGDLSVAYPLARAIPVLLIAAIRLAIGSQQIQPAGLVGMAAVATGCLLIPLPGFSSLRPAHFLNRCSLFALLAAVGTTGYTLVDDQALRILRSIFLLPQANLVALNNTQITIFYIGLESLATTLALGIYIVMVPQERKQLSQVLHPHRTQQPENSLPFSTWLAAVSGVIITGAYALVLGAMAYVRDVSYVSAFRQLSIPLGALLGLLIQKEPAYPPRIAGLGLIVSGLVTVALN